MRSVSPRSHMSAGSFNPLLNSITWSRPWPNWVGLTRASAMGSNYAAFGLRIDSEIELPSCPRARWTHPRLRMSPSVSELFHPSLDGAFSCRAVRLSSHAERASTRISGQARFLIRAGHEVIVQPATGASERDVRSLSPRLGGWRAMPPAGTSTTARQRHRSRQRSSGIRRPFLALARSDARGALPESRLSSPV